MINKFRGANRFLSNFYETSVEWEGLIYPSSEAAFQAAKTLDQEDRKRFQTMTPVEAKREGYMVTLRTVMRTCPKRFCPTPFTVPHVLSPQVFPSSNHSRPVAINFCLRNSF